MTRVDEFFQLIIGLCESTPLKGYGAEVNYGISQSILNSYNYKHNLPMERLEKLTIDKAKDIFMEFFYLPVKSIANIETHFNCIDIYYTGSRLIYNELINDLGETFNSEQVYDWRFGYYDKLYKGLPSMNFWLERIYKIKSYFKNR